MDKIVYFIRHGQTEHNRLGVVQGSGINAPLNDTGRLQATAFYEMYKTVPFESVLTSRLQRTHQTVEPFIRDGLPWEQFDEINEMHWGLHEGQVSTTQSKAAYKEIVDAWKNGNLEARLDGGESAAELLSRLEDFVGILKKREEKYLLVCSHGRAMRGLMAILKSLPPFEMERFSHTNTGLYQVAQVNNSFNFILENDTRHLEAFELNFHQ